MEHVCASETAISDCSCTCKFDKRRSPGSAPHRAFGLPSRETHLDPKDGASRPLTPLPATVTNKSATRAVQGTQALHCEGGAPPNVSQSPSHVHPGDPRSPGLARPRFLLRRSAYSDRAGALRAPFPNFERPRSRARTLAGALCPTGWQGELGPQRKRQTRTALPRRVPNPHCPGPTPAALLAPARNDAGHAW
jgi:hypothetical protein